MRIIVWENLKIGVYSSIGFLSEKNTPVPNDNTITDSDNHSGNGKWCAKINLTPTNDSITIKLYSK